MFEQVRGLSIDLERIVVVEQLQIEPLHRHRLECITIEYQERAIPREMSVLHRLICQRLWLPSMPAPFVVGSALLDGNECSTS